MTCWRDTADDVGHATVTAANAAGHATVSAVDDVGHAATSVVTLGGPLRAGRGPGATSNAARPPTRTVLVAAGADPDA